MRSKVKLTYMAVSPLLLGLETCNLLHTDHNIKACPSSSNKFAKMCKIVPLRAIYGMTPNLTLS